MKKILIASFALLTAVLGGCVKTTDVAVPNATYRHQGRKLESSSSGT